MRVYQCEDSLEGIFTAIYNTYEDKSSRQDTRISLTEELYLFGEYVPVTVDVTKAVKVMNTLHRRFGEEDYMKVCLALASQDEQKAQAIYQTIALGLSSRCGQGHLLDNLANDYVNKVFFLSRAANNELCHLRGFIRFAELENGILYSSIGPKNNILTFLMPHFADRMPGENFMIYDEGRNLFGVHPARKDWYLLQDEEIRLQPETLQYSEEEMQYRELFRHFCHKIAIKERKNLELQRNMLPLRFREYMIEFC
jgi:probable DNA metabolism protein